MDTRIGAWPRGTAIPLGSLARVSLDLITILVGFWLAYLLRYERHLGGIVAPDSYRPFRDFLPLVALFAAILVPTFVAHGLYRAAEGPDQRGTIRQVIACTLVAFLVLSAFVFYSRAFSYSSFR